MVQARNIKVKTDDEDALEIRTRKVMNHPLTLRVVSISLRIVECQKKRAFTLNLMPKFDYISDLNLDWLYHQ